MNWTLLVDTYLTQKRKLGYSLHSEGNYLKSFAHYAQQQDDGNHFTVALALRWANLAPSGTSIAIARRFGVLRPFSVYLSNIGYDSVILPTHFMGPTHRRLPPYIFSKSEIVQLMQATSKLYPENGLRPVTLKTFIGLLACTGLRPGEAVRLHNADVDLNKGLITVNNSKGWKQRIISLSPSASDELKAYVKHREQINSSHLTTAFFKLDYQRTLTIRAADYAFQLLREAIGLPLKLNGRYPRLYDIRHTFVCQRISSWYQAGIDVDSKIAQLSYYLGHKKVSDTYWYITAIPQLMAYAAKRFNGSIFTGGSK